MAHGAEFVQGAGALRRASGHVQEAKSNLDRTRRNLESDVTAMTARWQGEGGRSFQNMMRVFVQHHDELTRLLDTFSSNMDTSDTDGTSLDASEGSRFEGLSKQTPSDYVSGRLGAV
ncbi:MAG: hypothetical protein CMH83_10905 [Nocardioides sp.]|nr:hypothetical protein [Nocardioides sp.]